MSIKNRITTRAADRPRVPRRARRRSARLRTRHRARDKAASSDWMLRPAPIWPTIMPTVTRWPRIQGLPPIIAGSWVIREKSLMSHLGGGDAIRRLYLNRGPVGRPTRETARMALGRGSAVKGARRRRRFGHRGLRIPDSGGDGQHYR